VVPRATDSTHLTPDPERTRRPVAPLAQHRTEPLSIVDLAPERCDDDPGTGHSPIIEGTEPKEQHRDGR